MSGTSRATMPSQTQDGNPQATAGAPDPEDDRAAPSSREGDTGKYASASSTAPRTTGSAAEVIRNLTQRAADQGQEAIKLGVQVVAGAQAPLVNVGIDQGHRLAEASSSITTLFNDAVRSSRGDMLAAFESFYDVMTGVQRYQQQCFNVAARSFRAISEKRQNASGLQSPLALAAMQRDFYVESCARLTEAWSDMLAVTTQIAEDGMRPLKARAAARGHS